MSGVASASLKPAANFRLYLDQLLCVDAPMDT